nr:hypothetical protein [Streptomyces griseoflavus]
MSGSKPLPRSTTVTTTPPAEPVTVTYARPVPACRSTLFSASVTALPSAAAAWAGISAGAPYWAVTRSPRLSTERTACSTAAAVPGAMPSSSACCCTSRRR